MTVRKESPFVIGAVVWTTVWGFTYGLLRQTRVLREDGFLAGLLLIGIPTAIVIILFRYAEIRRYFRNYMAPCVDCNQAYTNKDQKIRCSRCHWRTIEEQLHDREEWERQAEQHRIAQQVAWLKKCQSLEGLRSLSGEEFEQVVGAVFAADGYEVHYTKATGDGGIDLNVYRNGVRAIVQCKNWNHPVTVKEVRELYGVLVQCKASRAYLITSSSFTYGAVTFQLFEKNLTLIDGPRFLAMQSKGRIFSFSKSLPR